jgi:hypothetical protein
MRAVSHCDDLCQATNVFTKHDHYHFIFYVSISNLVTEDKEVVKKLN